MINNNIFWTDDISILFVKSKLNQFVPLDNMNNNEKLNSLMRFSIYLTILLFVFNKNYLNFYIIISMAILTIFLHKFYDITPQENMSSILNNFKMKDNTINFNGDKYRNIKNNSCIKPTKLNPFMNRLMFDKDYPNIPNCPIDDPEIKNEIENNFNNNLYKNVGDIFNRNNSQRQYYTNAVTTNPNDQTQFANWLYKNNKTCKEGNDCDLSNPNIIEGTFNNLNLRYH